MSKTALTYRDYEALPSDGRRYEIHDGELSVTPSPSFDHQLISSRLYFHVAKWVEAHPGGVLLYAPSTSSSRIGPTRLRSSSPTFSTSRPSACP